MISPYYLPWVQSCPMKDRLSHPCLSQCSLLTNFNEQVVKLPHVLEPIRTITSCKGCPCNHVTSSRNLSVSLSSLPYGFQFLLLWFNIAGQNQKPRSKCPHTEKVLPYVWVCVSLSLYVDCAICTIPMIPPVSYFWLLLYVVCSQEKKPINPIWLVFIVVVL